MEVGKSLMVVKHPTRPGKERKSREASYLALMRSLPLLRAAGGAESRSRVLPCLKMLQDGRKRTSYGAAAASKMRDLAGPKSRSLSAAAAASRELHEDIREASRQGPCSWYPTRPVRGGG